MREIGGVLHYNKRFFLLSRRSRQVVLPRGRRSLCGICRAKYLNNELDLDRGIQRQFRHSDCRARVPACGAEYLCEQIGRSIDNRRLLNEAFGGRDKSDEANHLPDLAQRAQVRPDHGKRIQERHLGRFVALFDRQFTPKLALHDERAVAERQHAAQKQEIARLNARDVGRNRLRRRRKSQPKGCQLCLECIHRAY